MAGANWKDESSLATELRGTKPSRIALLKDERYIHER